MTKATLTARTTDELVERFIGIGLEQDDALLEDDYRRFNRLFDEMVAVEEELKSRPGDERRALLALYDHKNAQFRLNAIKATLAVESATARRALEALAASGEFPQAGDAGMTVRALDEGIFRPD